MKKVFTFLMALVFGLCFPVLTFAEITEENPLLPDALMSGIVKGTGTHFEVTDSEYLNITLDSSETITLRLESVPEMVTMYIESASEATSSQITIKGFEPSTTYYKYEDDYHNEETFTTDENGTYSWTQDLSQVHFVFIQPRKSTKFIKDDTSGGDCTSIGIWDSATKTCTLTNDVNETIQIDSNYITLDGNGHTMTGMRPGYGVYLGRKTGVTIKNLNVKNFAAGIVLISSGNNTLAGNTLSNMGGGIQLMGYSNNTLTGNTVSNNSYGILLAESSNNTLTGNTVSNNSNGIYLEASSNNTLTGNTVSNNSYGIYLKYSTSISNTLTSNTVSNSLYGIFLGGSSNTLTGNAASNNSYGILLHGSSNTLTGNTASNNSYGILLQYYSNNQICNNNFINNLRQASVWWSSGNIFNLNAPIGGNYWSDFDTLTEGCYDTNYDGFCDAPYTFYGGADNLPWTKQGGWEVPADTIPPITTITLSGTPGNNGWYVLDIQVILTATDNEGGSGVKKTEYSFDGTTWNTYSSSFTINNEGTTTVYYRSTDNAGNIEATKSITVKIDKISPTTSAVISGTSGSNGWYISDVTINLAATDTVSGVKEIKYSINGQTITVSGDRTSFTLTADGKYDITYYAVDNAGNIESQKSISINIDRTAPTITAAINPTPSANGWNNTDVTVTFTCSDSSLSGMASCPSPITVTTEGAGQTVTGTAVDNAGNSASVSVTLNIDKTVPTIATVTATPGTLWPPNHKMVDVTIYGSASDDTSGIVFIEITVTDEYGIYNMTVPGFGSTIQLEAWREGTDKDGRIYTITVVATDNAGNQSTATTQVIVPHDMRK